MLVFYGVFKSYSAYYIYRRVKEAYCVQFGVSPTSTNNFFNFAGSSPRQNNQANRQPMMDGNGEAQNNNYQQQ